MDIFKEFATDEKLEVEGAWFDLPGGKGARVRVARSSNEQFSRAVVKSYQHFVNMPEGAAKEEAEEKAYNELLAKHILVGWENLTFKGQPLPYSVENAALLLSIRDFRKLVQRHSDTFEAFRVKAEVEAGNA